MAQVIIQNSTLCWLKISSWKSILLGHRIISSWIQKYFCIGTGIKISSDICIGTKYHLLSEFSCLGTGIRCTKCKTDFNCINTKGLSTFLFCRNNLWLDIHTMKQFYMVKLLKLDLYILYTVLYGVYYNLVRIGTQNICTSFVR